MRCKSPDNLTDTELRGGLGGQPMIPRLLDEDRRVTPRAARKTAITSSRMAWALFDGLRTDDPGKGLQALDACSPTSSNGTA